MEERSQEAIDRDRLEVALAMIPRSKSNARNLLTVIVANAPANYVYRYFEGEDEYVRLWDVAEFTAYAVSAREKGRAPTGNIVWLQSVYPRAYYHLAFIAVEEQNYKDARRHLEAGLRLEPDHPLLLCELALVETGLGHHDAALALYEKARDARDWAPAGQRGRALRGMGFELIELHRLAEAEQCLAASLELEPGNATALNELTYIQQLLAGAPETGSEIVDSKTGAERDQKPARKWWQVRKG